MPFRRFGQKAWVTPAALVVGGLVGELVEGFIVVVVLVEEK